MKIFHHQVLIFKEVTEVLPQTPPDHHLVLSPAPTPSPRAPDLRGPGPRAPPDPGRPALRNPRPA